MSSWNYLIHFESDNGQKFFAPLESVLEETQLVGLSVNGYASFPDLLENREVSAVTVKKILPPVPFPGDIVCIGLNYRAHAEEANLTVPLDPVMWYKHSRALAGPGPISIPKIAQQNYPDFEGELVIVTAKDALNVSVEDAPEYILGYTAGNDLTARGLQDPKRGGHQFTRCKAFDDFAPLGPVLASPQSFGDLSNNKLVTKVNGKVFQDSPCDLIHRPAELISFLSQGTTLPAGSVILTGSPPGIGYFSSPQYQLKDGDAVSVEITGIGRLTNTMIFEK